MQPPLYIIAGCNGAGKTTASYSMLPGLLKCREFVNADEIAKGLSPFRPEQMAILAGKLMLQRIDTLMAARETFAVETTLATKSYTVLIKKARALGYCTVLIFFYLPSPEQAIQRVAKRVIEGGHHIPSDVIRRRYRNGIENLHSIYMPIVDTWVIIDNSNSKPRIIATNNETFDHTTFEKIMNQ